MFSLYNLRYHCIVDLLFGSESHDTVIVDIRFASYCKCCQTYQTRKGDIRIASMGNGIIKYLG